MSSILYLFADTNLFIQCRPLEELDWSEWKSFDEVHVIVSLPVLREIDYRKNKGSDRLGNRTRATNSLFRKITNDEKGHKVICKNSPRVKLYINPEYGHDPALANRLDYNERDDQLIGTISTFKKENPDTDTRLLTDDGTPMAVAKSLGIAFEVIPEAWLLPPETTDSEKKIGALETEISRLKKAEPQFKIGCLNASNEQVDILEYAIERFYVLSEEQLDALMKQITERFPIETDFGTSAGASRINQEILIPASEKEKAEYTNKQYPKWLKSCKDFLSQYHTTLNRSFGQTSFYFDAVNEGTRPGKDVLVTIEAKGSFLIIPPPYQNEDDIDDEIKAAALPLPPTPPRDKWRRQSLLGMNFLPGFTERSMMPDMSVFKPFKRDPNAFYYKPERHTVPQISFSLECDQWRHDPENWERFSGEIHISMNEEKIEGALECRIHAENLSESEILLVPVRITVSSVSVLKRAELLVQALK